MPGPDADAPAPRRSPIGRIVRRAVALVTLGLLTTFAVSTCCGASIELGARDLRYVVSDVVRPGRCIPHFRKPGVEVWIAQPHDVGMKPPPDLPSSERQGELLMSPRVRRAFDDVGAMPNDTEARYVFAHGWPLAAFGCRVDRRSTHLDQVAHGGWCFGDQSGRSVAAGTPRQIQGGVTNWMPRAISVEPIWPGVAVDTLLFATAWAILLACCLFMRRCIPRLSARAALRLGLLSVILSVATAIVVALVLASVVDPELLGGGVQDGYQPMPGAEDRRAVKWKVGFGVLRLWVDARASFYAPIHWQNGGPRVGPVDGGEPWMDYLTAIDEGESRGIVYVFGWPARCLWGGFTGSPDAWMDSHLVSTHRAILLWSDLYPGTPQLARVIPWAPHWPGLALNTALFAPAWFVLMLLVLGPVRLRSAHRLARGRCPRCNYPLGGAERCPECGTDIELGLGPSEPRSNP